jgi:hypothetical protein
MERVSSIHAEDNAIRKLPFLPKNKKQKRVDMLVVRVNRSGNLSNSKPCLNCIILMCTRLPAKGYTLNDVYFSTAEGTLDVMRLSALVDEDNHHVSHYDRK